MVEDGTVSWRLKQLEDRNKDADQSQDGFASKLRDDSNKIRDLDREIKELRKLVNEARAKAEAAAAAIEKKRQDEEAQARAMGTLARWAQIALTVAIMVFLGWSGQFQAAAGKLYALLGGAR